MEAVQRPTQGGDAIWSGIPDAQGGGIEPSNDSHRGQSKFGQAVLLRRGVPLKGDRAMTALEDVQKDVQRLAQEGAQNLVTCSNPRRGVPGKPSNVSHTPLRLFGELE